MSELRQNPWISILTKPKKTIREIVELNPNHRLLILSIIYGFCVFLGLAQQLKLGESMSLISIVISAIIFSPIIGYALFSFSSWLILLTGKLIKAKGSFKQIRSVAAWSNVPIIVNLIGWILLMLVFNKTIFEDFTAKEVLSSAKIGFFLSVGFIQLIASVWSVVIYINALSEIQGFSILFAILNIVMAIVACVLILLALSSVFNLAFGSLLSEPIVSLELF